VADAPNPLLEPIARVTKAWAEATDAERVTMLRRASIRNRDRMARDLAQQIAKLLRLWEEKPTDGHIPVLLREMDKYVGYPARITPVRTRVSSAPMRAAFAGCEGLTSAVLSGARKSAAL
jgi:hypothetical protein